MVSKGKPEKISKKCPLCKGTKKLPPEVAKFVPKGKDKCTHCKGKGFVFAPPEK